MNLSRLIHTGSGISFAMFLSIAISATGCATGTRGHETATDSVHHHGATGAAAGGHGHDAPSVSPEQALQKLVAGNARYVSGRLEHPDQTVARREEVAKSQHPFAIVLSCSDSRVPPEIVFDTGLGDLFVVRIAGNTADDAVIGSIEYAIEHLGATLVVVLGHERCGAVKATVDTASSTAPAPGHLAALLDPIRPAVKAVEGRSGDLLDNAVRENVARVVGQLKQSKPVLAERVAAGKLQVVGGRYDLDTGIVELK